MTYIVLAVLVMAALVFGVSAGSKLRSRAAFLRYRAAMAGSGLSPVVSAGLVAGEVVVAGGHGAAAVVVLVNADVAAVVRSALGLAALLSGALAAGVWVLIRRGVRARCACFGASAGRPIGIVHLVRNLTLLGLVLAALALAWAPVRSGSFGADVMAVVAGGCLALLIVRWEDLAVLVTPVPSIRRSG